MKVSSGRRSFRHSAQIFDLARNRGDAIPFGPATAAGGRLRRARCPREHPNRPRVDETISSARTAESSLRVPQWPPRRRRPQLPSGPPSGEDQDSRDTLPSPQAERTGRRICRDPPSPRTRLSRRPPGSASYRLSHRAPRRTGRSGVPGLAFPSPSLSPARVCWQE